MRHKEILARGVRVIGAGSIGALQAAELYPLSMVGAGCVFEAYVHGDLDGDDEVVVGQEPGEGQRGLTWPPGDPARGSAWLRPKASSPLRQRVRCWRRSGPSTTRSGRRGLRGGPRPPPPGARLRKVAVEAARHSSALR
ncbi:TfuA-like protein [Streptomyces sp. NPDC020681]|uniref:TfuA-like protein n=1 Tax=Streptomyces sp. NPDC020681 TaxID=3365083 RepID=UPI0037958E18